MLTLGSGRTFNLLATAKVSAYLADNIAVKYCQLFVLWDSL